jgi:DUF1680 family protein
MRGGEGLSRVAQSMFFTDDDGVYLTHFNDAEATLNFGDRGTIRLREETGYPFTNGVKITVVSRDAKSSLKIRLLAPSWLENPNIKLNGRTSEARLEQGFVILDGTFKSGDVIEYDFTQKSGSMAAACAATPAGWRKLFYGPLLLATANDADPQLPKDIHVTPAADHRFAVNGTNVTLGTVYRLLDPQVVEKPRFGVRMLFPMQ